MKIENENEPLQVNAADVSNSSFNNVNLRASSIVNADMRGCTFNDVNLAGSSFTNVDLTNVAIQQATMFGMTIDGISILDLLRVYRGQKA